VKVFEYAGRTGVVIATSQGQLEDAIRADAPVATEDAFLLARSGQIDVLVDVTGSVEFGAHVILEAFKHGKHVVLMNAEVDATIGPILQVYAEKYGVILSACEGDEPGIQVNLYRWVKGLGLIPRVMGNIKGLQDPYRNPTTQKGFAEKWGQNPAMVTSFADGSKISFEQSVVANATGFVVQSRGMSRGREYRDDVMKIGSLYNIEELRRLGGVVDYVVGTPLTKVYCLAEHPDPKQQHYLSLYKMGEGPLYSFFIPYHLVHFEVPNAIARVALFHDSVAKPLGGPVVEVCAVAKRELKAGEVLDDYGMYMTYGEAVNVGEMSSKRYLPEGLVEGCKLKRDIPKDAVITYDDVEVPANVLGQQLRAEQYRHFRGETWLEELLTPNVAPASVASR
ncbi:MAG TPA: SAF domain-containing protein, partial [Candidatus Sulfotelmatobacter sp.]|nr:SAF domain-containing protein [Candidatus Sulfotelmatobacter sp.]